MKTFIARGPVTVQGRDYRSGDTFEATPEDVAGQPAEQVGGKMEAPSGSVAPTDPVARLDAIVDAIGKLNVNDKALWVKSGAPKTEAIEIITGWPVAAIERDAAWAKLTPAV